MISMAKFKPACSVAPSGTIGLKDKEIIGQYRFLQYDV